MHPTLICLSTNPYVLVNDAVVLLRDIAGDAAGKVATKVKPGEEQLSQLDKPAEDNTWHEVPKMGDIKSNIQSKVPIGKKDAKEAVGDASQTAHPDGTRDPAAAADLAAQDQRQGTASGVDAKGGAKAGAENMKNKLSGRFDEDQKEKMRQYRERTNNYFKDKVPKERRDAVIFRLKKMVVEVQSHQDCMLYLHRSLSPKLD